MEDVTDTVFRRIVSRCGRPDVFFTEFIHTDVVLAPRGNRPGVTPRLRFTEEERPIVAQIWGTDPEQHRRAAIRIKELGFDGIDLNMGCPVRKIKKKGAGAALIGRPELAAELIAATRMAGLPVSVKTRIGLDEIRTEEWIGHLLAQNLDAIAIHGRTADEESEGPGRARPVHWNEIERAVRLRDSAGVSTLIIGNGDVVSPEEIERRAAAHDLDGVMVGRGVLSDPYLFNTEGRAGRFPGAPAEEKIDLLSAHIGLYQEVWGEERNYEILKKFFKVYLAGLPGADSLRDSLNDTHDYAAAYSAIDQWWASGAASDALPDEARREL